MAEESNDLFGKMLKGGTIDNSDPQMYRLWEAVAKTIELSAALNTSVNIDEIRERLSELTGKQIDLSTIVFIPFYTNFGKHITIGKSVLSIMRAAFSISEE